MLGFWGILDTWVDLSYFTCLAEQLPSCTLLIIGESRVPIDILKRYDNIQYLPSIAYRQLPAYGQHWDISLLPFKINAITEACDPLKLYEYLALGHPIVSSKLPSIAHLSDVVSFANTPEACVQAVKALLECLDTQKSTRLQLARDQYSWAQRARLFSDLLYTD